MRIFVLLFFCSMLIFSELAAADDTHSSIEALKTICDQAAASPLDDKKPTATAGVPTDKIEPKIAIPACEAAAKASPDDERIAFQLGRAYFAAKAYESALRQYAKADKAGYALATNNLAAIYSEGLGTPVDRAVAKTYLEKAANAGISISQSNLGIKLLKNADGYTQDLPAARKYLESASDAGYIDAMESYANMLANGSGGPVDEPEARRWYLKAADRGKRGAMNDLAVLLDSGRGGPKDVVQARAWFIRSADAGLFVAMENSAKMLEFGEGGTSDLFEARRYYAKAAEAGFPYSMGALGYLYEHGKGGPKDLEEARRWYRKAAEAGDANAMANLGLSLRKRSRWSAQLIRGEAVVPESS